MSRPLTAVVESAAEQPTDPNVSTGEEVSPGQKAGHIPRDGGPGAVTTYTGPARVVDASGGGGGAVGVVLPGENRAEDAQMALPHTVPLAVDSRVLVTRGSDGELWIIGLLDVPARRVEARSGAAAVVVSTEDGDMVEVHDPEGGLLFQYDPTRGITRLQVPEGDLELLAPMGEVTIAAGGGLNLHGRSIQLKTLSSVRVLVHDLASRVLGSVGLGRRGLEVRTRALKVDAEESELTTRTARVRTGLASLEAEQVRTRAARVELEAESLVQRVGNMTRWVRDLAQLRAGRVRNLVKGSWISRSRRADLRSKETFKVDGDRIHLG